MCGIAGLWGGAFSTERRLRVVAAMGATQAWRGPDGSDQWHAENEDLAFDHRRLSILDVSELGAQPMTSPSGRLTMVFNGEVYNYAEIRRDLEALGYTFRSTGDSEVALAAFEHWGTDAVSRFNGMFAFALWDRERKTLTLIRDRLGIKPLYYGTLRIEGRPAFVFGSDLSVLNPLAERPAISRTALSEYFRFGHVPEPLSIYEGIHKLRPGTYIEVQNAAVTEERTYWRASDFFRADNNHDEEKLTELIRSSVRYRMIADVPIGAFLSGGIDSSSVVATMRTHASDVRTFSIGFEDAAYDESSAARNVATRLGTQHNELAVSARDLLDVVFKIPDIFSEPFADSSQVPTYIVSKFAREQVTVALSGDGGDELFAGYNRHLWAPRVWNRLRHYPYWARRRLKRSADSMMNRGVGAVIDRLIPPSFLRQPSEKIEKLLTIADAQSSDQLVHQLTSFWPQPERLVRGAPQQQLPVYDEDDPLGFADWVCLQDIQRYLPGDILTKVDRASMAVSLEARVPLLDHRIVEYALSLRMDQKVCGAKTKLPLRNYLANYVPPEKNTQAKSGFAVPIRRWLGHELREWTRDTISPSALRRHGYLDETLVEHAFAQLDRGRPTHQQIWAVLMFQAWYENINTL